MNRSGHGIVIVAILALLFPGCNSSEKAETAPGANAAGTTVAAADNDKALKWKATAAKIREAAQALLKDPGNANWQDVLIDELESGAIHAALIYKDSAVIKSYDQAGTDAKSIVRRILKVLVEDGHKPSDEWISVNVHARQPMAGETGKKMWRVFGMASYDYNKDRVDFEDITKLPSRFLAK